MISESGINALRVAATLAHALPLRVRIHHDGQMVATVARPPFDEVAAARIITPCGFRAAVGEAWRMQTAGRPIAFCGLPDEAEPSVSVGVPPGGESFAGGIYQLPWPDGLLSVFGTTACPGLIAGITAGRPADVHVDRVTGASLVLLESDTDAATEAVRALEDLLVAVATEELIASLPA